MENITTNSKLFISTRTGKALLSRAQREWCERNGVTVDHCSFSKGRYAVELQCREWVLVRLGRTELVPGRHYKARLYSVARGSLRDMLKALVQAG